MVKNTRFHAISLILLWFMAGVAIAADGTTWPKVINTQRGDITIYQPQPETLEGTFLSGRAAVSVKLTDAKRPVFGAIWITCNLVVDRDTRIAVLKDFKVPNIRFSDEVDSTGSYRITRLIEEEAPKWNLKVSMDDLIATIESASVKSDSKLKNDPPEIIISKKPAVLVIIDGKPILKDLQGYDFQKIQNTPFFVVFDPKETAYYMYGDKIWFTASDLMGKWEQVKKPSSSLKKLQQDIEKANSQQNQEASAKTEDKKEPVTVPDVIVRTTPAELIVMEGEPSFTPIQGTDLLYVKNTDSDVFMDIKSQNYFVLISGRWYASANLTGPWTFTEADKLPADFAKIPEGSEKDQVLASVAGTDASKEAILDAQIPQTAEVNRKTATVTVEYDGEPKFEKVEGTSMLYAVNTPQTVLKVSEKYYCVDNGIWFEAGSPKGPWTVATERPNEVDKIEPSSTVYNVKYVYIYETTPEVVYVGYTPGYYGCYVYGPTVVYGTGYPYNPWYGSMYYPRPVTYGFNMHYNPYSGWSMSFGFSYGPVHMSFGGGGYYGGYWGPPMYHPPYHYPPPPGGYYGHGAPPYHGSYPPGRVPPTQGPPSGQRPPSQVNKPGTGGDRNQINNNMYANNRAGVNPNISNGSAGSGTSGNKRPGASQQPNNVYADKSGNVYQKTDKGWEQRQNNGWQSADKSAGASDRSNNAAATNRAGTGNTASPSTRQSSSYNKSELDRQSSTRDRGATRTTNSNSYSGRSSSSASRPASSPSRGFSGGGGRRR